MDRVSVSTVIFASHTKIKCEKTCILFHRKLKTKNNELTYRSWACHIAIVTKYVHNVTKDLL